MDHSFTEARGGLMLTEEVVGVRLPRHLNTLIAQIPGVGSAFAAMLPIAGVAVAIAIIEKLIAKNEEAKAKMEESAANAAHGVAQTFGTLEDKLLSVEKKADELAGDHLGALRKELALIDHATLKELESTFDHFAKDAQQQLKDVKNEWFELQLGISGQSAALTTFQNQYNALLDAKKPKEAQDLLEGTLRKAREYLATMQAVKGTGENFASDADVKRQEVLVQALENTVRAKKEIDNIGSGEKSNATTEEAQREAGRQEAIYEAQQRGLDHRLQVERNYYKEKQKLAQKAKEESIRLEEEEGAATNAVAAEVKRQAIKAAQEEANGVLEVDLQSAKDTEKAAMQEAKFKEELHKASAKQTLAAEIAAINAERNAEIKSYEDRIAALDKSDTEYLKKVQEFKNKEAKINKAADDQIAAEQKAANQKQLLDIQQAENKMYEAVATNVAKSIVENKNFAASMDRLGAQMLEGMIKNLIMAMLMHDQNKLIKAKDAAVNSYDWASSWGGPAAGAVAAAASFAAVMSFEVGGKVPGSGPVPIMAHGGETVVTKALTDRVAASEGGGGRSGDVHMHNTFAPHVQALDADGVDRVLTKHEGTFKKQVISIIRKMNR